MLYKRILQSLQKYKPSSYILYAIAVLFIILILYYVYDKFLKKSMNITEGFITGSPLFQLPTANKPLTISDNRSSNSNPYYISSKSLNTTTGYSFIMEMNFSFNKNTTNSNDGIIINVLGQNDCLVPYSFSMIEIYNGILNIYIFGLGSLTYTLNDGLNTYYLRVVYTHGTTGSLLTEFKNITDNTKIFNNQTLQPVTGKLTTPLNTPNGDIYFGIGCPHANVNPRGLTAEFNGSNNPTKRFLGSVLDFIIWPSNTDVTTLDNSLYPKQITTTTTAGATSSTAGGTSSTAGGTSSTAGGTSTTTRATSTTAGATSSTAGATSTTTRATSTTAGATSSTAGATSSTAGGTSTTTRATSSTAGATSTTAGATSSTAGATSTTTGGTSTTAGGTLTTTRATSSTLPTTTMATTTTAPTTTIPTTTKAAINVMLDSVQGKIVESNSMLQSPRYNFIDNQQRIDKLTQRVNTLMNNLQLNKNISMPEKPMEVTFY